MQLLSQGLITTIIGRNVFQLSNQDKTLQIPPSYLSATLLFVCHPLQNGENQEKLSSIPYDESSGKTSIKLT